MQTTIVVQTIDAKTSILVSPMRNPHPQVNAMEYVMLQVPGGPKGKVIQLAFLVNELQAAIELATEASNHEGAVRKNPINWDPTELIDPDFNGEIPEGTV